MKSRYLIPILLLMAIGLWMFSVYEKPFGQKETATIPIPRAAKVLVIKSERKMYLLKAGKVIRTYKIALGANPEGDKEKEGDNRTPEGTYVLDWRNDKSSCYRSIHISYPDKADMAAAKKKNVSPGGNIMIHGLHPSIEWMGKTHNKYDWTWGCIAVTNEEMDEIWKSVKYGTPIEIRK